MVEYRKGSPWWIGYLPGLDGLRGIAIALVVINHLDIPLTQSLGVVGVTVFFVISGFLITSLLAREWQAHRRIDFLQFYSRRIRRLFPALIVLLVVVTAVDIFNNDVAHIGGRVVPALLYFYNWIPATMSVTGDPLAQTWSLSVEEQFYLLWPLALLLALNRGGPRLAFNVAAALTVAALIDRGLLYSVLNASAVRIYFGSDTNAFALMAGCGLALALSQGRVPRVGRIASAYVGAAVAFVVVTSPEGADRSFSMVGPLVATVATTMVIARLVTAGDAGILSWAPLRSLGRISYSLYLWQTPVIVWGDLLLRTAPPVARVSVLTVASIACACASYRYVEAPLRQFGRARRPPTPTSLAATAAS